MRTSKTAVFQVRVDIRDIATLHQHYSGKGVEIKSVSTLTRRVIEFMASTIVEQLNAAVFETTSEAVQHLEAYGLMRPLKTKSSRALRSGMQEESLTLDGFSTEYMDRKGKNTIDPDQVQRAKELLQKRLDNGIQSSILGKTPGVVKGG